ncbi:MAG: hypothetical protein QM621_00200 [Aeromicrobium sp.]|uniref:hypothetical protein n=1 Tax=Aeromicrobium sp. TaxID=1871063 RepID=UPI0039E619A7
MTSPSIEPTDPAPTRVLLIDDKEGEGALLHSEWDNRGVDMIHVHDVPSLLRLAEQRALHEVSAAIVDLDLGGASDGAAGGLQAVAALSAWKRKTGAPMPIVLRTQDVDDDRSLAAALAAELHGGPLPLWGKSRDDALRLLRYLHDESTTDPRPHGGQWVHPVRLIRDGRNERLLGDYLFGGRRGRVWSLIHQEFDPDVAVLYAGYHKRHKFWEQVNELFSAIVHLRGMDRHLHDLGGDPIRVEDIQREIAEDELTEVNIALDAIAAGPGQVPPETQHLIVGLLTTRRDELQAWLSGERDRKPSFNRNYDQGEFLGVFGRVLGHPDVVDLFTDDD